MSDVNHATVSLKGAGRESLWIVLNGSADDMVQQIKDIFKFPDEQIANLDPVELIVTADSTLKAMTTVGYVLGGKPIPDPERDETGGWHGEPEKVSSQDCHGSAWERAQAQPDESDVPAPMPVLEGADDGSQDAVPHPYQELINQLTSASSIDGLKDLWAKNRDAFKNDTVLAAYKARGAELKPKK